MSVFGGSHPGCYGLGLTLMSETGISNFAGSYPGGRGGFVCCAREQLRGRHGSSAAPLSGAAVRRHHRDRGILRFAAQKNAAKSAFIGGIDLSESAAIVCFTAHHAPRASSPPGAEPTRTACEFSARVRRGNERDRSFAAVSGGLALPALPAPVERSVLAASDPYLMHRERTTHR